MLLRCLLTEKRSSALQDKVSGGRGCAAAADNRRRLNLTSGSFRLSLVEMLILGL